MARFDDNDLLADFIIRENINEDKTETTEADNQIKSGEVDARIDPYSEKYSYESCAPVDYSQIILKLISTQVTRRDETNKRGDFHIDVVRKVNSWPRKKRWWIYGGVEESNIF